MLTDEQLAKIALRTDERKRAAQERMAGEGKSGCYIPNNYVPGYGELLGRFYQDRAKSVLHPYREHRFGKMALPCIGQPDCEICDALLNLHLEGELKRVLSVERVVAFWITLQHAIPNSRQASFLKIERPLLLHGNRNLQEALEHICAVLGSDEAVEEFFSPDRSDIDFVIRLRFTGGFSPVQLSIVDIKPRALPPLPYDAPLLRDSVFPDGRPDPDMVQAFLKAVKEKLVESKRSIGPDDYMVSAPGFEIIHDHRGE